VRAPGAVIFWRGLRISLGSADSLGVNDESHLDGHDECDVRKDKSEVIDRPGEVEGGDGTRVLRTREVRVEEKPSVEAAVEALVAFNATRSGWTPCGATSAPWGPISPR
jgi:hypothetical protein